MAKRMKVSNSRSRRDFTKNAQRVHPKNGVNRVTMRGGIRL